MTCEKRTHSASCFSCLAGGVPAAPFGGDPGAGAPAMYGRGGGAPGKEE